MFSLIKWVIALIEALDEYAYEQDYAIHGERED